MGVKWFLVAVALIMAQDCDNDHRTALFQIKSRTQGLVKEEAEAKKAVCSTYYGTGDGRRRNRRRYSSGKACVFPFTYEGVKLNRCSFLDKLRPWCPTEERTDELDYKTSFEWAYCGEQRGSEERCVSDSPAEEQPWPSSLEALKTVEEVRIACLQRIEKCLWIKEKVELSEEEVTNQMNCVTSVCSESPSQSQCEDKIGSLTSDLIYYGGQTPMYDFCHDVANWQFAQVTPQVAVSSVTGRRRRRRRKLLLAETTGQDDNNATLLQRSSVSSQVDGGHLEETLSTKCL